MTITPSEIVVPSRTYVYLAAVGSTAPADATTALAAPWVNVGLTTPDSLAFNTEPEFEEVTSAQSDYPTRRFQTSDAAAIECDLQQWNAANFQSVYGGGEITTITGPPINYKFTPPKVGDRTEKAAVIEVIDGAKHYRFVFPRAMQVEGVELELQKAQEGRLALRLAVLGGDGTDPWYLLTDDEAFNPV
ncbi:hypothetical protein ABN028_20035 [Actinopolymorpha sp. B17G11]|uniref:phage tail tube protein n=1 Tax=Actinopolymorpha sp. B17G11 TaxID=3160861 RepID=UPI0032E387BC